MTAQKGSTKFVLLSQVLEKVKKLHESNPTPIRRRQIASLSETLKAWGDFVVYDQQELRQLVADSISHRLGVSRRYCRSRLEQINRIRSQ